MFRKNINLSLISILLFCAAPAAGQHLDPFKAPQRGFTSRQPAQNWQHSLISGNGTLGALVAGHPYSETIYLSHGGLFLPVAEPRPPINQAARLGEIRRLLLGDQREQAAKIPVEIRAQEKSTPLRDPFIPAFSLRVQQDSSKLQRYQRSVDFATGEAAVAWQDPNGTFVRSVAVSRPDSVVILRIKGTGKISCTLFLEQLPVPAKRQGFVSSNIGPTHIKAQDGWMTYTSEFKKCYKGGLTGYEGAARLVLTGGSAAVQGNKMVISDADEVLLLVSIKPAYAVPGEGLERIKNALSRIEPSYGSLLARHAAVHGEIFKRVKLDLGASEQERLMHTEDLLQKAGSRLPKALVEKIIDAGRYNIISCSGANPPNLQGLWTGTWSAPWSGDFTHNGNLPSAIANNLGGNMPELMESFFRYHEKFMDTYRENSRRLFGARGIHVPAHTSSNGLDTDFGPVWCLTFWTGGAGWAANFFYDYYRYTGDKKFLKQRAFPFMKEAALFYEDFLIPGADGRLMFNPSYSPENNPLNNSSQAALNATMDVMIAKQLLRNCIEAAAVLGQSSKAKKWSRMLDQMPAYQIAQDGSLREWLWPDMQENHNHRHASQLYSLYAMIDPDFKSNAALRAAANKVLEEKIGYRIKEKGGDMAFGCVQLGLAAAHLKEAQKAETLLEILSSKYWSTALGSFHNPGNVFNMDISGGYPAVVAEMLAYSEPGKLSVLPALPKDWTSGKVQGLLLRGQIELKELSWNLNTISIVLKSSKKQRVEIEFASKIISIKGAGLQGFSKAAADIDLPKGKDVHIEVALE